MFGLGVWELLIILAIILVLFGPKRLKGLGSDLGSAIKGFRSAVKEEDDGQHPENERVIDGRVERQAESADARKNQDSNV